MRIYTDLAPWWPLLSAPADYAEEAEWFLGMLDRRRGERLTLLELGSGGGNLASHLKAVVQVTLSDVSPEMIAVSRTLNPELEHIQGDMRTVRLGRTFDAVLIHDAIMYCTTTADLQAAVTTAAVHCGAGGTVIAAPDYVRESFAPDTETGGEDAPDGRGLRYLEWTWDPDPADSTIAVAYAIVLREADGRLRVELDHHIEGLFEEAAWLEVFRQACLVPRVVPDPWGRRVFVGRREEP